MAPPPEAQAALYAETTWAAGATGSVTSNGRRPGVLTFLKRLAAFTGPGYLIAVGYMDPGNWATDIAAGSKFGYALMPAVLVSGLAAIFLQWLSLRLGIATGRDLAQACRDRFSRPVAQFLWVTCEVAIIACDLAEVIGSAIALKLLFHMPMNIGIALTACDALVILALERKGMRYLEALVITLTGLIGICFVYEIFCCHPAVGQIASAMVSVRAITHDPLALYLALGIFGATVMPHNLYLHSSIAQNRNYERSPRGRREAIKLSTIDCVGALLFALMINAAILILASAAFHSTGQTGVAEIEDAFKLLAPTVGSALASVLFAVALLASGQNSTLTGTMAGQIVMEGFLGLRMNPTLRRLVTRGLAVLPALAVVTIAGEQATGQLLILSQVVLSLQLGFAVIPLVMFTSDRSLMGGFVNNRWVTAAGYALAAGIVVVNLWLVIQTLAGV